MIYLSLTKSVDGLGLWVYSGAQQYYYKVIEYFFLLSLKTHTSIFLKYLNDYYEYFTLRDFFTGSHIHGIIKP